MGTGGEQLKKEAELGGKVGPICLSLRRKEVWGLENHMILMLLFLASRGGDYKLKLKLYWQEYIRQDTILILIF